MKLIKKTKNGLRNNKRRLRVKSITKVSEGFTLAELVVTVAILGILAAVALPKFSNLTERTQAERNIANIHVIRETFFQYYFRQHMQGDPHFPPAPNDELGGYMDLTWANTSMNGIDGGPTPASLFSDGKVPLNSNKTPFYYEVTDTDEDGTPSPTIILEDRDSNSPTDGKIFWFSL